MSHLAKLRELRREVLAADIGEDPDLLPELLAFALDLTARGGRTGSRRSGRDGWLSTTDVAALIGHSADTVRGMLEDRTIAGVRLGSGRGRPWRIRAEEADRLLGVLTAETGQTELGLRTRRGRRS
jgi:excisionase family DNA binding protein